MNGIEAVKRSCDSDIQDLTTGKMMKSKEKVCAMPSADAGTTTLEMSYPPTSVDLNSIVTFEGKLTSNDTCKGIANAEIDIYEKERSFMGDDILASGVTNKNGAFMIDWKAKQQDWWDDSVEVFAKFGGTEKYHPSKTDVHRIRVLFYLGKKY